MPFPLVLQRGASAALRAHVRRDIVRVAVLLACDIACLMVIRFLSALFRDAGIVGGEPAAVLRSLVPRGTYPVAQLLVSLVVGLLILGNYRAGDHRRNPGQLMWGTALGLGLVFWSRLWAQFSFVLLIGFFVTTIATGLALVVERSVLDTIVRKFRRRKPRGARTLIIGPADSIGGILQEPIFEDDSDFQLIGYLTVGNREMAESLGSIDEMIKMIDIHRIDTVILSGPIDEGLFDGIAGLVTSAGCQLFSLPQAFSKGAIEPTLEWRRGVPLLGLTRPGLRGQQLVMKRFVDIAVSGIGLVALAPVFVLVGVLVKLSSPGPVFFSQLRVGLGGKRFRMYKFRSMTEDAERRLADLSDHNICTDPRIFKIRNDPRTTRLGRLLRQSSIDELPQLWNVLKGEMSLVGPRPPLPTEVALYEEHHYSRFDMRPGVTGPWQVNGRNKITDFDEVIRLERAYMRHWSIWKDLSILARTVPVVLRMSGAH